MPIQNSLSSSQTMSNIVNYNPNITVGDDNESKLESSLDQRATSEALAKNSATASVGVGVGGDGSGGSVMTEDVTQKGSIMDDAFLSQLDNNTLLIGGGALMGSYILYKLLNKKKKKK